MTDMLRGRIYRAHLAHIGEDKFFLVVSNNRRNRAFEQVLAARLTTTPPRHERPAMVALGPEEVMSGWVSCDDIETIYDDEVRADAGAISATCLRRVEAGLRAAFGIADLYLKCIPCRRLWVPFAAVALSPAMPALPTPVMVRCQTRLYAPGECAARDPEDRP